MDRADRVDLARPRAGEPPVPEPPTPGQAKRRSTRQRIGAGVAIVTASAVAVGVVLGAGPSSSQGASKPAKSSGAATVARRDLVSTDSESGTLGYANAQTVFNRLSGTITSLPTVGKVISPGQPLYRVDGAPVVLFDGGTPAFRDLSAGVGNGLDVQELKSNLKTLGFDPGHQITVNQTFDAATTAAVERWQASLGQTQTGTVTLGQIVFLPGPQRITKVDTVLGSTGGASSASTGTSTTSGASTVVAPRAEFVSLTTNATPSSTTSTTPATGSGKPSTCPTTAASGSGTQTQAMRATEAKIAALCRGGTGSTSVTSKQTLAALIALLKAETLLLQRSASSTGKTGGSSSSGVSGGGRGAGGGTAGTGASSGTGSSGGGGSTRGGSASGGSGGSASGGSGGSASGGSASGGSTSSGSTSSGSGSGGSASGGSAQAILQTTSTQPVVTVDLDATKQSEAVVGQPVTVELPSGGTVEGKITGVSPVAQSASSSTSSSSSGSGGGGGSSSSSTPSATVPVTIALKGHRAEAGLDQAAVSVNFEQQVENNVLSVPVTALLATSGGGYAVQEASAGHRLIPVTPGLFAAGFVQVSGAGIYPGLQITDSQG